MYTEYERFASRANRDARYKELKERGAANLRRRTARNTVLDPYGVEDFAETRRTTSPNGFGGCAAMWWPVLYVVEYDY